MKLTRLFIYVPVVLALVACGNSRKAKKDEAEKARQQAAKRQQTTTRNNVLAQSARIKQRINDHLNLVSLVKARHGQVTIRGILVKDSDSLKEEFKNTVYAQYQHGKDHTGATIQDDEARYKKVLLSPQVSAQVAGTAMQARPGTTLVVGYDQCVADIETDKSCFEDLSKKQLQRYGNEELRVMSLACDMEKRFGIEIRPELVRLAPVRKNHREKVGGANLEGDGITARGVQNVILCGQYSAADFKFITGLAENVVLKNFNYDLNGNYGYSQVEIGAKTLYLQGNNRLDAKGREGGQVHPPKILLEVIARVKGDQGARLQIVSVGSDVEMTNEAREQMRAEQAQKEIEKAEETNQKMKSGLGSRSSGI